MGLFGNFGFNNDNNSGGGFGGFGGGNSTGGNGGGFGPFGFGRGSEGGSEGPKGGPDGGPSRARPPKPPKGTKTSRLIKSLVITLIFAAVYFYLELPAINVHDTALYWFLGLCVVVFTVCNLVFNRVHSDGVKGYVKYCKKNLAVAFWIIIALVAIFLVGTVLGLVIFRAKSYSKLISVETGDFASEVTEINWDQIPMLDADSANNLANRKLGELSDLVSQFTVNDASTQINFQGAPVRTTYLDYDGFFKWISNRSEGIPAYMAIDMRTQEVTVVRLEEGIKYSPSEYFSRDLMRYLRFSYPTCMFDEVNFEIDEEGTPYWVASVITKKIGLYSGTDVIGAVLLNAVTGETEYYEVGDVPSWVDRVYSADLIVSQYDYYGKYHNGFWNSIFVQSDCTETTSGYNYIAQDDDVWMYTGITSVTGDRGNIGFILVNQRTKESRYYSCAGAEEYSAMSSAEGAVQQFSYSATFPLLLNISEQPTYFMALKDEAGLVKQYAMVNVQQYQIVATGTSMDKCLESYKELLLDNNIISSSQAAELEETIETLETASGKILDIRDVIIDGNTVFYVQLEKNGVYYAISAKDYPEIALADIGDALEIVYEPGEGSILSGALAE